MMLESRRKIKALLIIAMLAVAKGRKFSGAFPSSGSSSSNGEGERKGKDTTKVLDSRAPDMLHSELDILIRDPAFHEQLNHMAGHMDRFAKQMKAKPVILARAKDIAKEMFALLGETSYSGSTLPEQMEAMIAAQDFQEQAQLMAEDMQKFVVVDADFAASGQSMQSAQKQSEVIFDGEVSETMPDPSLQRQQDQVSRVLHSLVSDPDLQIWAEMIAASVEQMKDAAAGPDNIERQIAEQVNAVLASLKLRGKASNVILETMSSDLQEDLSGLASAVENPIRFQLGDEWLEREDLEELAQAVVHPGPTLVKAMDQALRAETSQPVPLEEDHASLPVDRFSAAISWIGSHPVPMPERSVAMGRPAFANMPPQRSRFPNMPVGRAAPQGQIMANGALGALTSAKGIRSMTPSLVKALSSRGGAVMSAAGEAKASAAKYAVGNAGSNDCPSGYANILTASECQAAALALGMKDFTANDKSHAADVRPKGCFTWQGTSAFLNPNPGPPSNPDINTQPICVDEQRAVPISTASKGGVDVALLLCFALWYLGNYYYNISNKLALTAAGGAAGFPMSIATLQLGVGVIYALFMWLAPDVRTRPQISFKDYVRTLPVGAMSAGAHAASVFALSAGSVSFAQIVKASEPAFAAVIGTLAYSAKLSKAKWLSLIPVIGGVCLASLGELNFAMGALVTASIANIFAAVKGNENNNLMKTPGLSARIGSVGNQFAITTINAFLFTLPVMLLREGARLGEFFTLLKTSPLLFNNLIGSGMWFYLYNELATMTIKKTDAVTQSVANTAKRVIVIIVVALVMKESLAPLKLIGSGVGIGGVFLYSIVDKLAEARKARKAKHDSRMIFT